MSVKKGAAETRRLYHSAAYECGLRTAECRIFLIPLHQDNLAFQSSSWITITNPVSLMCVPSYFYSSLPIKEESDCSQQKYNSHSNRVKDKKADRQSDKQALSVCFIE